MKEITPNNIRALSWKQPYGSLMLHGKIETRTWNTNYRGLVLICTSQKPYLTQDIKNISGNVQFLRIESLYPSTPICGHAIAIGELVDCRPMLPDDENKCFVEYRPGLYCHIYDNVKPIEPIPYKGSQGWGKVPQEVIDKIKFK